MRRLDYLFALALASTLVGAAFAQEDRPAVRPLFRKLDGNGDGKLTRDEIPAEGRPYFERLLKTSDSDGDGVITRQEFSEGTARRNRLRTDRPGERGTRRARPGEDRPGAVRGAQFFKRLDRNGDGKITRDEIKDAPEPRRARLDRMIAEGDRDGDGALSRRELLGVLAPGARDRAPRARTRSLRAQGGPAGRLFALLDADRDGKLTNAELKRAPKLVSRFDVDGDRALSVREILAASPGSAARAEQADTAAARKARKAEARRARQGSQKEQKAKEKAKEKAKKVKPGAKEKAKKVKPGAKEKAKKVKPGAKEKAKQKAKEKARAETTAIEREKLKRL